MQYMTWKEAFKELKRGLKISHQFWEKDWWMAVDAEKFESGNPSFLYNEERNNIELNDIKYTIKTDFGFYVFAEEGTAEWAYAQMKEGRKVTRSLGDYFELVNEEVKWMIIDGTSINRFSINQFLERAKDYNDWKLYEKPKRVKRHPQFPLNFIEALEELKKGKRIKKIDWDKAYLKRMNDTIMIFSKDSQVYDLGFNYLNLEEKEWFIYED